MASQSFTSSVEYLVPKKIIATACRLTLILTLTFTLVMRCDAVQAAPHMQNRSIPMQMVANVLSGQLGR